MERRRNKKTLSVNPNYIPVTQGIEAWYDASDLSRITHSTGDVTAWLDKSGNGYDATANTGNARTGDSTENSKNILVFTNDNLTLPSDLYSIPNDANTLFVVSKRASEDGSSDITIGMANATSEDWFHAYSATSGEQDFENSDTGSNEITASGITNTNLNITCCRRTGTSQGISVNAGSEQTNSSASNEGSIDDAFIGSGGAGGSFFNGSIAEIAIFSRYLNDSEKNRIEKYLSRKWGVALSQGGEAAQTMETMAGETMETMAGETMETEGT